MMLSPGWAQGTLIPVCKADFRPAPSLKHAKYPAYTRAGVLQSLTPPETLPFAPTEPWIAAWKEDLNAENLLNLHRSGARGVLIAPQCTCDRHAVHLATALGIPMRAQTTPTGEFHRPFLLSENPERQKHRTSLPLSPWITRVTPLSALSTHARTEIELLCAQPEEIWSAQNALQQGVAQGIGLVRLEYLVYTDPGMDETDLFERLCALLNSFRNTPIALRLTDWHPSKPPPPHAPLAEGVKGPGFAHLKDTPALRRQLSALQKARIATGHTRTTLLLPRTERAAHIRALQAALPGWKIGAMIESPLSEEELEQILFAQAPIWLGMGDWSTYTKASTNPNAVRRRFQETLQKLHSHKAPTRLCGPLDHRLISGTLM